MFLTEHWQKEYFVFLILKSMVDFPDSSVGQKSTCSVGDPGSIPGSGRSAGERIGYPPQYSPHTGPPLRICTGLQIVFGASSVTQLVTNPPAMQETLVQFLGWEDPLQKEVATHSSILAWIIPWTGNLVGYSPWDHKESDTTE